MRRLSLATALAAGLALAGCTLIPGLMGVSGMNPQVLAVTQSSQGMSTAVVNLSWTSVSNAALYQVSRAVGPDGTYATLASIEGTSLVDPVSPGKTLNYHVDALNSSGNAEGTTATGSVTVLDAQVGKPTHLMVDGMEAANSLAAPNSAKPVLAWTAAASASLYYVTLNEGGDAGKVGKLVYASLTKDLNATLGTLALKDLTWQSFPQVQGSSLVVNKIYIYRVTAIRADSADLTRVHAIDVAPGDDAVKLPYIK